MAAMTTAAEECALVPKLRFPEFRDAGEWKEKALSELGNFFRGITYSAKEVVEDGLLVLRSSNIQDGALVLHKDLVFIDKTCPNDIKLKDGDILICMSNGSKALVGKSAEYHGNYEGNLTAGAFCSIFRPSIKFSKLIFQSEKYRRFISVSIGGGNINNLKNSDLEEFKHPIPKLASEQQKIADCLASIDELITLESQKLDTLKLHKKGLMQQLFPAEGETAPRLRFPEFRDAEGWSAPMLAEISKLIDERVGDRKLTPISISAGIGFVPQVEKFGRDISGEQYRRYTVIRDGDFVYNKGNSIRFPQGCIYDLQGWGEAAAPNVFICFRLKEGYENGFFRQYFEKNIHGIQLKKYITSGARSNGLLNISKETFFAIRIPLPSKAEQQKIADCLGSLDDVIAMQARKVDALKTHKKGLMQQLFPRMDEVEA